MTKAEKARLEEVLTRSALRQAANSKGNEMKSDTNNTPETFLTVSNDELQRMFREAKSNDFTRAQFEQEKTKRIAALCEALKAVDNKSDGYGPFSEIMSRLKRVVDENYNGGMDVY